MQVPEESEVTLGTAGPSRRVPDSFCELCCVLGVVDAQRKLSLVGGLVQTGNRTTWRPPGDRTSLLWAMRPQVLGTSGRLVSDHLPGLPPSWF